MASTNTPTTPIIPSDSHPLDESSNTPPAEQTIPVSTAVGTQLVFGTYMGMGVALLGIAKYACLADYSTVRVRAGCAEFVSFLDVTRVMRQRAEGPDWMLYEWSRERVEPALKAYLRASAENDSKIGRGVLVAILEMHFSSASETMYVYSTDAQAQAGSFVA